VAKIGFHSMKSSLEDRLSGTFGQLFEARKVGEFIGVCGHYYWPRIANDGSNFLAVIGDDRPYNKGFKRSAL
tara:strand:+ start:2594 stop:2809 length:216 start_codon:yes stop_codon:yes gene_type:complete